jgi:hypothetical protein
VYELIEIKDIKSIKIVPYTLMMSSISAILAFIYAIIIVIIFGVIGSFIPNMTTALLATLAIAVLIGLPAVGFLIGIVEHFLTAFLYNSLVPRLGAIKLGFEDLREVKNIAVVPFALMLAGIGGIVTFLIMLIVGPLLAIGLQGAAIAASTSGTAVPGLSSLGALGIIGLFIMVIGFPIGVFIAVFISTAVMAIFYNYLAPKMGGIEFNFVNITGNIFEIESIPVVKFALIIAVVMALFNLLVQLINMIISVATGASVVPQLIALVVGVLGDLVIGFIVYAITAFLYNYLRPKIGGVKLEIE